MTSAELNQLADLVADKLYRKLTEGSDLVTPDLKPRQNIANPPKYRPRQKIYKGV